MRAWALAMMGVLAACSKPMYSSPKEGPLPASKRPKQQLYQGGKRYTPQGERDDRYSCQGSPADETACQAVRGPGFHCVLEPPVGYWEGEIRCSGAAVQDWEMERDQQRVDALPIPGCECSCTDEHVRAADAFQQRLQECANVP
jgi:hypothetical protein